MAKQVILTGLRANNDLHIGNYFGALLPLIDMAKTRSDEYDVNLFVPDLHSFTTPIDHSQLQAQIQHNLRLFAAAGLPLDNPNVHIYRQSYIPAHSELTWILDCFTSFGEMRRMTQFKDKSGAQDAYDNVSNRLIEVSKYQKSMISSLLLESDVDNFEKIKGAFIESLDLWTKTNDYFLEYITRTETLKSSIGIFNYPVLMAADILLYGAKYVPVGEDQTQHLEFTRDIATRMNSMVNNQRLNLVNYDLFVVPEPTQKQHEFFGSDQGLRIKDLADPTKKMSKSDDTGKGCIFLGDSPEEARKKVMSATTDSLASVHLDYDNQPGVSNLLQILALLTNRPLADVANEHQGQDRYGDFKAEVADAVANFLTEFQAQLANVDETALMAKLESDEAAMNVIANDTLLRVQKAVGLR